MKIDEKAFAEVMEKFTETQLDVDFNTSRRNFIQAYEDAKEQSK